MTGIKNRSLAKLLTTSNQDVYVVPGHFVSKVYSILVSNKTASGATVTLEWYDSKLTTWYAILGATSVAANALTQLDDVMYLQSGDKIRALASTGSAITVTISVEETFRVSEL